MSKLNGSDPTSLTEFSIEEEKDGVVISIGDTHVKFDPETAEHVAEIMLRYAYHIQHGVDMPGKQVLSKEIQRKIENRIMLVIANLQERNAKPINIAREVMGIVMREVT